MGDVSFSELLGVETFMSTLAAVMDQEQPYV